MLPVNVEFSIYLLPLVFAEEKLAIKKKEFSQKQNH